MANVEVHVPFASSNAVTPGGGPHRRRNDEGLRDWAVPLLLWATVQLNNLAQHRHHLSIPIDSLTLQHSIQVVPVASIFTARTGINASYSSLGNPSPQSGAHPQPSDPKMRCVPLPIASLRASIAGVCMCEYSYVHAHAYALVRVHVGVHVMLSLCLQDRLVVLYLGRGSPSVHVAARQVETDRQKGSKNMTAVLRGTN